MPNLPPQADNRQRGLMVVLDLGKAPEGCCPSLRQFLGRRHHRSGATLTTKRALLRALSTIAVLQALCCSLSRQQKDSLGLTWVSAVDHSLILQLPYIQSS